MATAGAGTFVTCAVALGTVVAGWAAPSGIALGFTMGLAWATLLELPRTVRNATLTPPGDPEERESQVDVAGGDSDADEDSDTDGGTDAEGASVVDDDPEPEGGRPLPPGPDRR